MVKTIVVWVFVAAVIIFLLAWVLTGGISRGLAVGKSLFSPAALFGGNASGTAFVLPWQQPVSSPEIDLGEDKFVAESGGGDVQSQIAALEGEYDQLKSDAERVKLFGTPSPYVGLMKFVADDARATNAAEEYVQLEYTGDRPIPLTGWSIQSAYTGVRAQLPSATEKLVTGTINAVGPATIQRGESIVITSGSSPVGVSFRTNMCSGYLQQFQAFSPPLPETCPDPGAEMSLIPENLQKYGETCFDYVQSLPKCHFPSSRELPETITPACKSYVTNAMSYNGCVTNHFSDETFGNAWRLYLNSKAELWRNSHDIIRLLDNSGRTVDVLSY